MRTLALLAALLLLAFQAQAQTLQEKAEQVPAQDQSGDEAKDEPGTEDQDVAISFTGEEHLTRRAAGSWKIKCQCRRTAFCNFFERNRGSCRVSGHGYRLCCR